MQLNFPDMLKHLNHVLDTYFEQGCLRCVVWVSPAKLGSECYGVKCISNRRDD